jgi:aspartate/methionine/tyrosine aminotransferase
VAGAIAFVGLKMPMTDVEFCDRVREERSVLFVPGTYLGMGGSIRVGFGYSAEKTRAGLERADDVLDAIAVRSST